MRVVTASLIGLLVASPLLGQEPEQREREHVVRTGDTLWDLAGFYLQNPFQWPVIYQANTAVVEDPHWIYPSEVLRIPGRGMPVDAARPAGVPVAAAPAAARPLDRPLRTVFYREPVQEVADRPTVLSEPDLTTPPVKTGEFLAAEFLADPDDLRVYGRMIRPVREISDMPGIPTTAHPEDLVYIGYWSRERPQVGQRMLVVSPGRRLYSETYYGARVIRPTAVVEIVSLEREVMVANVVEQYGPVHPDQLVMPMPMVPDFRGMEAEPTEGGGDLNGQLTAFVDEQPLYSRTDRAFIDLGSRDGVQVGDVFLVYLPERAVRARATGEFTTRIERVPPSAVAEVRVVRVNAADATVKVDRLMMPRLAEGLRVTRVRKMP